jgi:hypothetical protein
MKIALPTEVAGGATFSGAGKSSDPTHPNPLPTPARREREDSGQAGFVFPSPRRGGAGGGVTRLDVVLLGTYNGGAWAPACLTYLAQRTTNEIRSVRFAGG